MRKLLVNFELFYTELEKKVGNSSREDKVNSVQEAYAKCYAVHILDLKSCKPHEKPKPKRKQHAKPISEKLKTKGLMFQFFHAICKISHFNM